MKTIRQRIQGPFLAIIITMPLAIILIFNLIVAFQSKKQAETDLKNAVLEISENIVNGNTENIITLIKSQSHSNTAELITYGKNGKLSNLFSARDTFITEDIANLAYEEAKNLQYEEIGSFRENNDTYYVIKVDYSGKNLTDTVLYISKGLVIDDFVNTVNIVLVLVSFFITIIALFVSSKVTSAISKPIENLTELVLNMKSDEILVIQDKSDSLELKKLTNEINALNRRIYHYNESQKNFLQNASHELRTPLMSIQGYADGIEMEIFKDYKGTSHLISDQCKRLTKLVDSLLTLARAENFNANKKLERLNLSDFLSEIKQNYNGYAMSKNIEIISKVEENIFINSNEELLLGAVGNIISNAIRYANSLVYISLEKRQENAVIIIKDDGKGIENIDKIFDRFSKGEDGNFGLGLSIAKTSVKMMEGEIFAFNQNGALFEIHLKHIK